MLDKRQTRVQFLSFFVFQGKKRETGIAWLDHVIKTVHWPANRLFNPLTLNARKEWSLRIQPSLLLAAWDVSKDSTLMKHHFPESGQELWWSSVWHFCRRGTDVSLVKRPKREGTQGDGCIRRPREMPGFYTPKIGPDMDTTLKEFRRDKWHQTV